MFRAPPPPPLSNFRGSNSSGGSKLHFFGFLLIHGYLFSDFELNQNFFKSYTKEELRFFDSNRIRIVPKRAQVVSNKNHKLNFLNLTSVFSEFFSVLDRRSLGLVDL